MGTQSSGAGRSGTTPARIRPLRPEQEPAPTPGGETEIGGVRGLLGTAARLVGSVPAVAGATGRFVNELGRVVVGTSEVAPGKRDKRFADTTWTENPAYRRMMQGYLAACRAVGEVVEEADLPDWRDRERARFIATLVTSTLAPTNTLANPAALKRALETGGGSLRQGLRNLVSDVRHNKAMPSQVDRSRFKVGEDLAVTPGAVVYRDEVLELLQYRPTTNQVRRIPLVVVPPQINKYYFMDLAPGRSLIEYAVGQGQQTFAISWRNPTKVQRDWDLDTYCRSILAALDAIAEITKSDQANLFGLCAGGITAATVLNHLADKGEDRVRSVSFGVTLLDWGARAQIGMLSAKPVIGLADWRSRSTGVLDARTLSQVFTWMRPDDLVWSYWVNNYLLGNDPPSFDILAWNSDGTNLPAALHHQFLDVFSRNTLARRGELTVLGSPVDLKQVTVDAFITGGTTDHLTPWNGCYASATLLGGDSTFVLTNTGHIQTLVCPPGNPKSRYWTGPDPHGIDADTWREQAEEHEGTWWEHWAGWIAERSGPLKRAPARPGSTGHPSLGDAPGTYVHAQA
ncbi:MAG: alpha/beta fold hydrolase [Pseudonocardia sp.]|nr:alpha/beta fold hydrolase [Pseudonocardia sp.]